MMIIKVDKSPSTQLKIMQVGHVLSCKMGQNFCKMYKDIYFGGNAEIN